MLNLKMHNVKEILDNPENYVGEFSNTLLLTATNDDNDTVHVFVGVDYVDGDFAYYICAEDGEVYREYTPDDGESLYHLFLKVVKEWIFEEETS